MENNGQLLTRATFTSAMKYYFWMMDWFYFQFKKEDGKNNWLPTTVLFFNLSKYDNECLDKCSCFIFFIRLWSIHNCYLSFLQWGFYFCKVFFFISFFVLIFYCIFSILNVVFRRSYFPWYFCTGIVSWIFLRKNWLQWIKIFLTS